MTTFPPAQLAALAAAEEIDIVLHDGQQPENVTVWIVAVGDTVWLRSWKGARAGWYRRVTHSGSGSARVGIAVGDETLDATLTLTAVSETPQADIDAEYLRKYGHTPYAGDMNLPPAVETTFLVEPAAETA